MEINITYRIMRMMRVLQLLLLLVISAGIGLQAQTNQNLTVGGANRSMIVYAPSGIQSNSPLVISMHGMGLSASQQQSMTHWNAVADTAGFVVVYPNSVGTQWDIEGTTDIEFLEAIIDEMYKQHSIDKKRVYLSGFSMGGMMTYHAANNIADKIAAFGPVAGYMSTIYTSARPIPIIHTHGTSDNVVPYSAGNSSLTGVFFPGIETIVKGWAERDGCNMTPVETTPYPVGKSNQNVKKVWTDGDCGTEVVFISLKNVGHTHSDDANGVYTTTEIWNFVRNYSLDCGIASSFSVSITSPKENAASVAPASIPFAADVAISEGTVSHVDFFLDDETAPFKVIQNAPYEFDWETTDAGTYTIRAVAYDNQGNTAEDKIIVVVSPPQAPYGGTPHAIPGTIQFEDYDLGGNGFAYFDTDEGSSVTDAPDFRTDEDVDIEKCTDVGNGYNIGFALAGEWLEYTVDVAHAGKYDVVLRASTEGDGKTVSLTSDGAVLADKIAITNTKGWQDWVDITIPDVELKAGEQVLRLTIGETDFVNLNYMSFISQETPLEPIQLTTGWNLIGCPLDGSPEIAVALASIWDKVVCVKDMDSFYMKDQADELNLLQSLEWGKGYFVKVSADCELIWKK